jgi:hypothetical protein
VYPATASLPTLDDSLNPRATHPIKIVGRCNLSRHKAQAPKLIARRGVECGDFDDGLTRLRDDERLTGSRFFDELRQLRFGLMNVDRFHMIVD